MIRSGAAGVQSGRVVSVANLPEVFPHALGDKDDLSGCMSVGIRYFEAASGRVLPRGVVDASGADEVKTVAAERAWDSGRCGGLRGEASGRGR